MYSDNYRSIDFFQWIEKSVSLSTADWYNNGPGFLYINIGISFPLQRSQTFTWSCITYDNIYSGYLVPSLNSSGNDVILFDTNYFKQTSVVTFYVDIIGL